MYGGSGKLGRGRGGGPVKRNIHSTFQPSSVQRPSATPGGGRLSAGGGGRRNSTNTPAAPAAVSTADETFSLVRNNPLNFGMIIKLTPVLVEEIKRLESEGGAARIKFDSSAKNLTGNVINVGGKEFRFTWSQETGDLCDIYEEQRGGDNGDGLLVESGGAWRKLNVQRELDDKVQNQVKMRTVEAERQHKSRKAIILDHGNPSMKNQVKAMAAAEVNSSWKSFNKKKEPPFKKQKAETSTVIPPKSGVKLSSSTPSKIRPSASPLLFTPEQSGAQLSPFKNNNFNKVQSANREETNFTQFSKENATTSENKVPAGNLQYKPGSNDRFGNKPTDLQSLLVSLLMEKPQGMNIKALEKAVGETIPTSVKQIEPILKRIAVLKAPGKYILKPDVDLDSSKKSLSESGSSPENNNTVPESGFPLKTDEFEQPVDLISEPYEDLNIDIDHISPDVLIDKKYPHNNEDVAVNPSLSRSESDSDSSDSDSPGQSGSSSDSDSDASSNSKQGSDEDVDIMSDDDKEPKIKSQPLDHNAHHLFGEKDGHHESELIELEKDLFEDNQETDFNVTTNTISFPDNTNLYNNNHGRNDYSSKRGSEDKHFDDNENSKRLKSGDRAQTKGRNSFSESPISDGPSEGPYKVNTSQTMGRIASDYDYEKVDNHNIFGNPNLDSPKSGQRSIDLNARAKPPADLDADLDTGPQDNHFKGRKPPKNSGSKHSSSHQKKHGAQFGKIKEPSLMIKDSHNDMKNSPAINGRGPTLRRELSDLEMGEFRENLHEEQPSGGNKTRFEKNNSFKQSENNKSSSGYWNLDDSKGKPAGRTHLDPKNVDDFAKVNDKPISRLDLAKSGSHHSKAGASQNIGSEPHTDGQGQSQRKVPHKHEKQVIPVTTKDKKRNKSKDIGEKKKDFWNTDNNNNNNNNNNNRDNNINNYNNNNNNGLKRREIVSCSDESITSYIKYEKDVPEMKGPIRDLSQYNEYVQEYREKYDCYNTLNKTLEAYRNEFQTFGRDLELAKGRDSDRYNKILEQLMESYRQCGAKHKRLKKIFVVLHHELQHLKEMIKDFADKQTKG